MNKMFGFMFGVAAAFGAGTVWGDTEVCDGVWLIGNGNADDEKGARWATSTNWKMNRVASGGGVADLSYFDSLRELKWVRLASDVTISELRTDHCYVQPRFYPQDGTGARFVLTGDARLLTHLCENAVSPNATYHRPVALTGVLFDIPVVAASATTVLHKEGGGAARFSVAMSGFAKTEVKGGTLVGTMNTGTFLTDSPVELCGGNIEFAPSAAAGTSPATTLGSLSLVGKVNYVKIHRGSADAATLTVENFSIDRDAICVLLPTTASALGVTEKILIASGAPTPANGMIDGRFVVLDQSSSIGQLMWATYDETDGFKAVAPVYSDVTSDHAGYQFNRDASFPVGAVMIRPETRNGVVCKKVCCQADFGDKPGVVWVNSEDGAGRWPAYDDSTKFISSVGMWFLGAQESQEKEAAYPIFNMTSKQVGWSGWTRYYGCRLYSDSSNVPDGDVYILGGEDIWGGDLWPTYGYVNNYSYGGITLNGGHKPGVHWHLDTRNGSFFANQGGVRSNFGERLGKFFGPVSFDGLTRMLGTSAGEGFGFYGPVDGAGNVIFTSGNGSWKTRYEFHGPNTRTGAMDLRENAVLSLAHGASLGTGPLYLASGTLEIGAITNRLELGNRIVPGSFELYPSAPKANLIVRSDYRWATDDVAFNGETKFLTTSVPGGAKIGVGANVDLGDFTDTYGQVLEVYPTAADSQLRLSAPTDRLLGVKFAKGTAGTSLTLNKTGAGKLTLGTTASELDALNVEAGTVALASQDFWSSADIAWWLDAEAPGTVTTDADGAVTNWASRTGNGVDFHTISGFRKPTLTTTSVGVAGRKAIAFAWEELESPKLATALAHIETRPTQATVVMVVVPHKDFDSGVANDYNHVFGRYNTASDGEGGEFGVRLLPAAAGAFVEAGATNGTTFFDNQNGYRINGVSHAGQGTWTSSYQNNKPNIIVAQRDNEIRSSTDSTRWASPRFRPQLGSYVNYTNARGFRGDYCEVIAFNRILTDDELKYVENYLYRKWIDATATLHANVPEPVVRDSIANAPAVRVDGDATLDLNGKSLTVASLAGFGKVVNSAETPARLTVTGDYSFRGTIGSGVVVDNCGGSARIVPSATRPPETGMCYWLDASKPETVLSNANGAVTGWVSRLPSTPVHGFFRPTSGNRTAVLAGGYHVDALRGKPAVEFQFNKLQELKADSKWRSRTLFFMWKYNQPAAADNYESFFGLDNVDSGIRLYGNVLAAFQMYSASFLARGDLIRCNGTAYSAGTTDRLNFPSTDYQILVLRLNDGRMLTSDGSRSFAWLFDRHEALGDYCGKGAVGMYVSEVLAYDYPMSNEEIAAVEQYLTGKWVTPSTLPEEPTEVFASPTTVAVEPGATGSVTPIVLDGDQDLSKVTLDVSGVAMTSKDSPKKVLEVTGSTTGDFADVLLPRRGYLEKRDDGYYLGRKNGMVIVVE